MLRRGICDAHSAAAVLYNRRLLTSALHFMEAACSLRCQMQHLPWQHTASEGAGEDPCLIPAPHLVTAAAWPERSTCGLLQLQAAMQGHLSLSGLSISSGMLVNRPGLKVKVGDSRDSSARHDDCSPLHQGALPPARCLDRPAHWVRLAQGCIWATVRMHCWTSAGA